MLEGYSAVREINPGKWQGLFFQLHPAPSGFERHILRFSTNTRYETAEEAKGAIDAEVASMNQTSPSRTSTEEKS